MRVATWNLERKTFGRQPGLTAIEHLQGLDSDVLVVTETRTSYPYADGALVSSQALTDSDERKVVMWARNGWTDVDDHGADGLPPGRFVSATTSTPVGDVRVMGVCVSWHMANVKFGAKNRKP